MELDSNSSTPLYMQLEDILLQQIKTNMLKIGNRLPTEEELSSQYKVSRVTVRKALSSLSEKCYIERRPGKGSFISEPKIQRSISSVISFTEMCQMQGVKASAKTLHLDFVKPTEEEQGKLKIGPQDKILLLERLRYANDVPVSIEISKFPKEYFFLFDEDLTDNSLYAILKRHNINLTNSIKVLEIIPANYREYTILQIPRNHPLLSISSEVSEMDGSHLHLSKQLCVADRFKYIV